MSTTHHQGVPFATAAEADSTARDGNTAQASLFLAETKIVDAGSTPIVPAAAVPQATFSHPHQQ